MSAKKSPRKPLHTVSWIIGILILAIAGYLVYDQALHAADRQKFMTLKADILALQEEFNQIDPGWEYSEACHAKGGKFQGEEASSCGVEIRTPRTIDVDKYKNIIGASNIFKISREYNIEIENNSTKNLDITYSKDVGIDCGMTEYKAGTTNKSGFTCHDSALDFYFPKNQ